MSDIISALVGGSIAIASNSVNVLIKKRLKKKDDASHLAALVTVTLEKFLRDCVDVSNDDGTYMGEPAGRYKDGEAYYKTTTHNPDIILDNLSVEWRSISPQLMRRTLSLKIELMSALSSVNISYELDCPPYFDYMHTRQKEFTILGLKVIDVIDALEREVKIKPRNEVTHDIKKHLSDKLCALRHCNLKTPALEMKDQ